jgi:hypothetical protein
MEKKKGRLVNVSLFDNGRTKFRIERKSEERKERKSKVVVFMGDRNVGKTTILGEVSDRLGIDNKIKILDLSLSKSIYFNIDKKERAKNKENLFWLSENVDYCPLWKKEDLKKEDYKSYDYILIDTECVSRLDNLEIDYLIFIVEFNVSKLPYQQFLLNQAFEDFQDIIKPAIVVNKLPKRLLASDAIEILSSGILEYNGKVNRCDIDVFFEIRDKKINVKETVKHIEN